MEEINKKIKELKKKYGNEIETIRNEYQEQIDNLCDELNEMEQEVNNKWKEEVNPLEEERRNLFLQIVKKDKLLKGSEWEKINYSNKLICKDKILSNKLYNLSGDTIHFTLLNNIEVYLFTADFLNYNIQMDNKGKEISFQDAVKLEEEYGLVIKCKGKLK